jgi:hypothetical protein
LEGDEVEAVDDDTGRGAWEKISWSSFTISHFQETKWDLGLTEDRKASWY